MKFNLLSTLTLCAITTVATAQNVGINNTTPHPSAILDIASTNKGLLIPRLPLTSTLDVTTVPAPQTSVMVYNTATAGIAPNNVKPGYYYYDGAKWATIGGGDAWMLTGNAGTNSATNFVGTTDAQDLVFKTNSVENMRILNSNGNIGIGTTAPTEKLQVTGKILSTNAFSPTNSALIYTNNTDYLFLGPQSGSTVNGATIGLFGATNNEAMVPNPGGIDLSVIGASPALRVLSTGNVGIGTTAPNNKLEITGTGSGLRFTNLPSAGVLGTNASGDVINQTTPNAANALFWGLTGNSGTTPATNFVGTTDAQDLVVRTNSIEKMRILSNGQIGIGIAIPNAGALVDIVGPVKLLEPTIANPISTLIYTDPAVTGVPLSDAFRLKYDVNFFGPVIDALVFEKTDANDLGAADGGMAFVNTDMAGTSKTAMVIRGDGKVGIGTTAPGTTLHLHSSSNNHHALRFTAENQTDYWDLVKRGQTYGGGANNNFVFSYNSAELIDITPSGNLGINVVTPTEKLHIAGSVRIVDGTEGLGKKLTSDATGKGSWAIPASDVIDVQLPVLSGSNVPIVYTNYTTLNKGTYLVTYYNCMPVAPSVNYFLVASAEASAGNVYVPNAFVWDYVDNKPYTSTPFVMKVTTATANVRGRVSHNNGGTLSDSGISTGGCSSFTFVRIGD